MIDAYRCMRIHKVGTSRAIAEPAENRRLEKKLNFAFQNGAFLYTLYFSATATPPPNVAGPGKIFSSSLLSTGLSESVNLDEVFVERRQMIVVCVSAVLVVCGRWGLTERGVACGCFTHVYTGKDEQRRSDQLDQRPTHCLSSTTCHSSPDHPYHHTTHRARQ